MKMLVKTKFLFFNLINRYAKIAQKQNFKFYSLIYALLSTNKFKAPEI